MSESQEQERLINSNKSYQATKSGDTEEKKILDVLEENKNTQKENSCSASLAGFYNRNSFLIKILASIGVAFASPPVGAYYLKPQITATWIAVVFIFFMSGVGLKTEEFASALKNVKFNVFVQSFNFFAVSFLIYWITEFLVAEGIISKALADGMKICSCLPVSVNAIMVLAVAGGGDEASAVFSAAFGNGVGIFLSPPLIFAYVGVQADVDVKMVFLKLVLRVILPIVIGQILRKNVQAVVDFVKEYKPYFKTTQEWCLVFIIYTVFCKTFLRDDVPGAGEVLLMISIQWSLLAGIMGVAWFLLSILFKNEPKLRVTGLFACSHKTVAMGVPLIGAIYENDPNVGLYTLPLLVWHPTQIMFGTFLTPMLAAFVKREEERIMENNVKV